MFFKLLITFICILAASPLQAQITTDGTLGPTDSLIGPHCRIKAELGKQVRGNLFHSFAEFNISKDGSATFTGPNSVENIISRVTGGSESRIDGWLRSEIPGANLYLLNPRGVIFGKNAVLDIDGSFHVSTADYLRLGDSGRFDATQPEMSSLTAAAPAAFGFLTDNPKGIAVESKYLIANPGQSLSLIGGDIDIRGGVLAVESGRIDIGSTASAGEVIPDDSGLEISSSGSQGKISMSEGAQINVSSRSSSGNICIRGGRFEITGQGTSLLSEIENGDGGNIDIRVSEDVAVRDGAVISTASFGTGRSGDISLNAANLKMTGGGIADATALNSGSGGAISVTASFVEIFGYGQPYKSGLYAETGGTGNAGSISISSDKLTIADNGTISGMTAGEGKGGEIALNVKNLDINSGGIVSTAALGSGRSGNISINATESVIVSGTGILGADIFPSRLDASTYSDGDGGNISIETDRLTVSNDGLIQSVTKGNGQGGDISLNADQFEVNSGGSIDTSSRKSGASGNISITADESVTISGYGQTCKSGLYADTAGTGDAGNISVSSDELTLSDKGTLSALTIGEGNSGEVSLNVKKLEVNSGGIISTAAFGSGRSGNISINATESVIVSGTGILGTNIFRSSLDASTYGNGDGGNISVTTDSLTVSNDGLIQSVTKGSGEGRDISLTADRLEISRGGQILTNIFSSGHGGNILISARESVTVSGEGELGKSGLYADAMTDSSGNAGNITVSAETVTVSDKGIISGQTGGSGNAGDIVLNADNLKVNTGGIVSTATSGAGQGGNMQVKAQSVTISESGTLTATSQSKNDGGDAGDIAIQADAVTVSDNGLITNGTSGKGNGGNITIETDRLDIDRGYISSSPEIKENKNTGNGGDIAIIAADSVRIAGSGQDDKGLSGEYYGIYAQTQGDGDGGSITIKSDSLTITQDAMINGQTYGSGKGGDVTLEVARLEVSHGGVVTTSTRGAGNSGDISVTAQEYVSIYGAGVKIEKGSTIYSATHSSGSGGDLTISAPVLMLRDKGRILAGTILSDKPEENNTLPDGPGGNIRLEIRRLEMSRNALISSESDGMGDAGFIRINAAEAWLTEGSRITTDAKMSGGGKIAIDIQDSLRLSDSEITTSVREGTGSGGDIRIGNIAINPEFVILNHSNISANADAGDGGAIFIAAENYFRSSDSVTQASSNRGNEGTVRIETPDVDLTGSLTLLPGNLLDVSQWLKTPCAQRSGKRTNRFVIVGRDAIPLPLDDWLPAPPLWGNDAPIAIKK